MPSLHAKMTDTMVGAFGEDKTAWPVPGVPVTCLWYGCGPTILHKDDHAMSPFLTVPLSIGMAGSTVLVFPELQHGFYCQPGDICAFDGTEFLHGLTLPSLTGTSSRLVLSLWIDMRIIRHVREGKRIRM